MNAVVWDRNIILKEDDMVYEKISYFEKDEEGLERFILIN
jgi:hypothetical protein